MGGGRGSCPALELLSMATLAGALGKLYGQALKLAGRGRELWESFGTHQGVSQLGADGHKASSG